MAAKHQSGAKRRVASVNNIQAMREARGWSRPELGRRMGTSGQQVERLEKAMRRLTQDWIDRAAEALAVSASDIISKGADLGPTEQATRALTTRPDQPPTQSASAGEVVEIIRLDLSLPMGPGATVDDYVEEEPISFDLAYVRSFSRTPPHRLRLAKGVGDSMFPTLNSNDLVWIDSTQTQINQQDRVWAVSINGGAAIKRLRRLKAGRVMVVSDNPAVDNYEVGEDELLVGGRVIRFARDL